MRIFLRDLVIPYALGIVVLFAILIIRNLYIHPFLNWFSFILTSAVVFIINALTVVFIGKLIGVHLYFRNMSIAK